MKTEQKTYAYFPKGEWKNSLLDAFQNAGMEFKDRNDRSYQLELETIPIIFQLCRSKDVLTAIDDEDTQGYAGFTGSDIVSEQRLDGYLPEKSLVFDQDQIPQSDYLLWSVAVQELSSQVPDARLYLGKTKNADDQTVSLVDFADSSIYTPYPKITRRLFDRQGINAIPVKIKPRNGGIEGWNISDPTNKGVIDIEASGGTRIANDIEVLDYLLQVELLLIISSAISYQDKTRMSDLQEKLFLASRRKS